MKNDAERMDIWRGDLAAFFSQPTPRRVPEDLAQMAVCCEKRTSLLGAAFYFSFTIIWLCMLGTIVMGVELAVLLVFLVTGGCFLCLYCIIRGNVRRLLAEGRLVKGQIVRRKVSRVEEEVWHTSPFFYRDLKYAIVSFHTDLGERSIRVGPLSRSERNRCEQWRKEEVAVNVLYLPDELGSGLWPMTPRGRAALIDLWSGG